MAELNFPDPSEDNATFDAPNGSDYTYNSADNSWTGELAITLNCNPTPSDITASPAFDSGTGTELDPYIITPQTVILNGSTKSAQYITIANQPTGKLVRFSNATTPSGVVPKFNQPIHVVGTSGSWEGYLVYSDEKGMITTSSGTNTGKLIIGSVYFTWIITQTA